MSKTITEQPVTPVTPATVVITGILRWRSPFLKDDCRSIAICADGEALPADDKNRLPLRTIILNIDATAKFEAVFGRYLLRGAKIHLEVLTSDLATDLANRIGIQGTGTAFVATDFWF